jgi:hypothetical protein
MAQGNATVGANPAASDDRPGESTNVGANLARSEGNPLAQAHLYMTMSYNRFMQIIEDE